MKFILGKKIEMTQVWKDGRAVSVTKVQAGPCFVVQIKTKDKDGYRGVQIGFGEKKEKNIRKPQIGHFKKVKEAVRKTNFRYLKEFRLKDGEGENLKIGDLIGVNTFENGNIVDVTGISKGKGFAGVVKRHGFKGSKKTHGNKDQERMPGSIGVKGIARVFKGLRMGGRMGGERVTTKNLNIVEIDNQNNILFIEGSVPGARNGLVFVKGEGELKVEGAKIEEVKNEIPVVENKEVLEDKKEEIKKES